MNFNKTIRFAAGFSFLALLSGCGADSGASKKLMMWHVGSEEEAQIINRLARERFTPATGIGVQCDSIAWSEAHSKFLTAMAGDVTPDIATMGLTWGTEFGSKGQMVDLRKAFPAELEAMKADTFPSIWAATEYRGSVYAVPFDMTLHVLYYRTDLLPQPPKNWDELTTLLSKLNKQDKSMIIDWGSLDWIGFSPFLWQAGGDYYNDERTKSALRSPAAAKGMRFFADLYRKYQAPKSGVSIAQGLRSGQYPLGMSGNWLLNSLPVDAPELDGKWTIALLPAGPSGKRTGFIGGRSIGIFSRSAKAEEAWKFIQFLAEVDVQKTIYEDVAKNHNIYMPPNVRTWEILPIEAGVKKVLVSQAKDAKAPPSVLGWNDSTRFVVEAIQKAIIQGLNPAKAMEESAAAMDEHIEKP